MRFFFFATVSIANLILGTFTGCVARLRERFCGVRADTLLVELEIAVGYDSRVKAITQPLSVLPAHSQSLGRIFKPFLERIRQLLYVAKSQSVGERRIFGQAV